MGYGRVGFIGLGQMGAPILHHLLTAGIDVVACDIDTQSIARAKDAGATIAARAVDVADLAETVLICLPTPATVEQVCTGPDGLLHGRRIKRVVDHSTTGPDAARRVELKLGAHNIAYLDAPLAGSTPAARAGTLSIMVAGPLEEFATVRPLLDIYGETVSLIGTEVGQGHLLKLINNMILCATLAASTEAMLVGLRSGIPAGSMLEMLNRSTARSFASRAILEDLVAAGTPHIGFRLELMRKDLRLLLEQGEALGLDLPLGTDTKALFDLAQDALGQDADVVEVVTYLADRAGTPFG